MPSMKALTCGIWDYSHGGHVRHTPPRIGAWVNFFKSGFIA
jgi:hypothetical protein